MKVAVATDHGGYALKETVLEAVRAAGHTPLDLGTNSPESVDYPDYARKVGASVQAGEADRGVLLCGSGIGVCIAANKMKGIYAALCHDTYSAHQGVEHDNMNVLCLGARVIGPELTREIVISFLEAGFLGHQPGEERHARRVGKVKQIEMENLK